VQTIDQERHPLVHKLLTCFHEKTGCPVLINTSFNVRGEPIVCTPEDAYRCFIHTDMDVLVLGRFILHKQQQETKSSQADQQEYLAQFQLD
jgi:carbamoyltransferase